MLPNLWHFVIAVLVDDCTHHMPSIVTHFILTAALWGWHRRLPFFRSSHILQERKQPQLTNLPRVMQLKKMDHWDLNPGQVLDPKPSEWGCVSPSLPLIEYLQHVVVVQSLSCVWLCDLKDCSTPDFPVHHQLPELAQTHVHQVSDAIQPSHPLLLPSPPAFNLSQHQGLSQRVSSSHQVARVLELQLQHQSFQWILLYCKGF